MPLQQEQVEFADSSQSSRAIYFCINQQELAFQLNSLIKNRIGIKLYC
jgi:hypothetical protein